MDVLGPVIEVFTATGAYYWVDASQIVSLEFSPVEHLTDMLWRAASIENDRQSYGASPSAGDVLWDGPDQRIRR